jgi:hypothetical protein
MRARDVNVLWHQESALFPALLCLSFLYSGKRDAIRHLPKIGGSSKRQFLSARQIALLKVYVGTNVDLLTSRKFMSSNLGNWWGGKNTLIYKPITYHGVNQIQVPTCQQRTRNLKPGVGTFSYGRQEGKQCVKCADLSTTWSSKLVPW